MSNFKWEVFDSDEWNDIAQDFRDKNEAMIKKFFECVQPVIEDVVDRNRYLLYNQSWAEDIVQSVEFDVIKDLDKFDPEKLPFKTFIYTVIKHHVTQEIKELRDKYDPRKFYDSGKEDK